MKGTARDTGIHDEAIELAATLARALAEAEPDAPAINELFRCAHSLKGLAGILDARDAAVVAHAVEDGLDELRHGRLHLDGGLRAALLRAVEACRNLLDGADSAAAALAVASLETACANAAVAPGADPSGELELPAVLRESLTDYELARLRDNLGRQLHVFRIVAGFRLSDFDTGLEEIRERLLRGGGELIATLPGQTEAEISFELLATWPRDGADLRSQIEGQPVQVEAVARSARPAATPPPLESDEGGEQPQRVRVSLAALRELERAVEALAPDELRDPLRRLTHVPAADLCARVRQTIRSFAMAWGRQVRLETEGEYVEVHVAVAETLSEPLLHLVRNALDHGVEPVGQRARRRKPVEGRIRLGFLREGASLVVEVEDDGAGIDPLLVEAAARRAGAQVEGLHREELLQLVFLPGLSTAGHGGPSGRGVGLDVVQAAVARLGGSVSVASRLGSGTTFTLRIPDAG